MSNEDPKSMTDTNETAEEPPELHDEELGEMAGGIGIFKNAFNDPNGRFQRELRKRNKEAEARRQAEESGAE